MDSVIAKELQRGEKGEKEKSGGEAETERAAFPLQRKPLFLSHALIQRQLASLWCIYN